MTGKIASLPMYDADRAAVEAWWGGISCAVRSEGLTDIPSTLSWPADLDTHWRDPQLLLSQTCGYPLVTRLKDAVQVVGVFRYTAPGCRGIHYRSELIVRSDDTARKLGELRGRAAALNAVDSHSGANALQALVAPLAVNGVFFGRCVLTGSHRRSIEAVQSGRADIAAIDCVTLAGLRQQTPERLQRLRVLGSTPAAPGLPLVTAAATSAAELKSVQKALGRACDDPALAEVREALFIGGFEIAAASAWQVIEDVRRAAAGVRWPEPLQRMS